MQDSERDRCKEQIFGLCGRRWGWDDLRKQHWNMYITICEKDDKSHFSAWNRALKVGAPRQPRGMGCGRMWEGVLDEGHMCTRGWFMSVQFSSVAQLCLTLWPHESQHTRPPCPSPTPGVHSDSRPLSLWCHPTISSSVVPFSSCPQSLPASVFSNESTLHIRWPKYWSFSFRLIYLIIGSLYPWVP